VDDDPQILRAVRTSLHARGYEVITAANGETAIDILTGQSADIVLLDLGLPGIGGLEVLKRARTWTNLPVIVLTVIEAQAQKVAALDAGADDYLTKPFAMEELLARMRAVARRAAPADSPPVLHFGELEIDLSRELVRVGDDTVRMTPTEYRLLEAMVTRPGKLLTHSWLLQRVWGPGYSTESHYLRVFVRQLRKKLGDDPTQPRWIVTEPGLGYRWGAEPD
jgi:two-component system KDP operon response regulator KdpE